MNNSESEKRFIEVENMPSRRSRMKPLVRLREIKIVARVLIKEVGHLRGLWILSRTGTWDAIFNRPKWHPELFEFKDPEEKGRFKKAFRELAYLIVIFNNLKNKYGEFLADEITAKIGIPCALSYRLRSIDPIKEIESIDQVRQLLSDYLGDGVGFEWTEEVSEDRTEVRYNFTKCSYLMILRAYGMQSFAGHMCLADHVFFDNVMPMVILSRENTIGVGDSHCDHVFRIRTPQDKDNDESRYKDCHKVRFGGRDAVQHWEEVYKNKNGQFKF